MRKILSAIVARNGTIGRSAQPCTLCCDSAGTYIGVVAENRTTDGKCRRCGDRYYIPANDKPWAGQYLEHDVRESTMTMHHSIIVGARTARATVGLMGVQNRELVMLTKETVRAQAYYTIPGHGYARSLRGAIHLIESQRENESGSAYAYRMTDGRIFFLGGARLFAEGLSLADELELTLIDRDWYGDVKFPGWIKTTRGMWLQDISDASLPGWACIDADRSRVDNDLVFTSWRRK
jgi:hypothetical protein